MSGLHWRWKCWRLPAVQMRVALMCSNQVTNLQRQAQPQNINGRWGRQKNFDASRCFFLFFFSITAKFQSSQFPTPNRPALPCPAPPRKKFSAIVVDCQKVGLSYMIIWFFASLSLSANTFERVIHTFTVITPEYRFISPYSKMEGKCECVIFKIQQTGLKTCHECILHEKRWLLWTSFPLKSFKTFTQINIS